MTTGRTTRLAHLTDLHFGLERTELIRPLHEGLQAARPDLVVVSGDLTQRARSWQFRQAMDFLRGLDLPFITIPGNHDIPLINLFARLFFPFRGYRRYVSADMTPELTLGRLRIFSANTADPFSWRGGVLRREDLQRICAAMDRTPREAINILVCHHPLKEPPGFQRGETRGAVAGLPRLERAGLDIVLSGHLHHWVTGLGLTPETPRRVFQMQSGTALCAREGERDHGFTILDIGRDVLEVTVWLADETTLTFNPTESRHFRRDGEGWHVLSEPYARC